MPEAEAHLGSAPENDLVLRVPGVSRRHAVVQRCPGGVELVDRGSKNGLLVAGQRVERTTLTPGLRVQIGLAWLEVEEISDPSREALARIVKDASARVALSPSTTASLLPSRVTLEGSSSVEEALTLACYIAQAGTGVPGKRNDLLIRIKATLGADIVATLEKTPRGKLRVLEGLGNFTPDDLTCLVHLSSKPRSSAHEGVVLRRDGRLLLVGSDTWFLATQFSTESLAQVGWRKDLLRFLAAQLFLPVRDLDALKSSEALRVLALVRGRKRKAATLLGISPSTLYKLIAQPASKAKR